jgi:hypothetical protein
MRLLYSELFRSAMDAKAGGALLAEDTSVMQLRGVFGVVSQTLELFVGTAAAVASRTVVAPLERLKIVLQTAPMARGERARPWTLLRQLVRQDGVAALFRGNGVNALRLAPCLAANMVLLPLLQRVYLRHKAQRMGVRHAPLHVFESGVLGGVAAAVSNLIVYPLDVWRCVLAVHRGRERLTVRAVAQQLSSQGGLRAHFRGVAATSVYMFAHVGAKIAVFEHLRSVPLPAWVSGGAADRARVRPALWSFACGAAATVAAQTAVYPFDVLRRRMQLTQTRGLLAAVRELLAAQGWRGLYRGLSVNTVKTFPAAAVSLGAYEWARNRYIW